MIYILHIKLYLGVCFLVIDIDGQVPIPIGPFLRAIKPVFDQAEIVAGLVLNLRKCIIIPALFSDFDAKKLEILKQLTEKRRKEQLAKGKQTDLCRLV